MLSVQFYFSIMIVWVAFVSFVLLALALDLGVFNRTPHVIKTKEAAAWTTAWVLVALAFSGIIYLSFQNGWVDNPTGLTPWNAVVKYVTGYLIELSLSIDNIFVIAIIFSFMAIPRKFQHEVLFYGVLGAIVSRAMMIVFGVALINQFNWIIYVFGGFLLISAVRMFFSHDEEFDLQSSKILKWINKIYPVTHEVCEDHFFIRKDGVKYATPLFAALIIIEFTDVFFAIDSIPAILTISTDPFIVFSSNILAIIGLRSMFFLIADVLDKFKFIHYSLAVILGFVGIKMLLSEHVDFPEWISLLVIFLSLLGGGIFSKLSKDPS